VAADPHRTARSGVAAATAGGLAAARG